MKTRFLLLLLLPILFIVCTPVARKPGMVKLPARALTFSETTYQPIQFFKTGEAVLGTEAKLKSLGDKVGLLTTPKQQTFDVDVLAYGEIARGILPRMKIRYGSKVLLDTLVEADPAIYEVRNLAGNGDSLIVILANDYYDPNTKEDTNLIVINITIRAAEAGQVNLFADSIRTYWDRNTETDLAGYFLHLGNRAGEYYFDSPLVIDTTYKFVELKTDTTYFIAVSAIDTSGNESDYSEELRVRLFAADSTSICDIDGDGEAGTPSDFTLFDWYFGFTRGFFLDKFSGADLIAVLSAFDRADLNHDGIVDPSDSQTFDLQCLSK